MTVHITSQVPLKIRGQSKGSVRTQFGALCWKMDGGKVRVLLVTTRGRQVWTIPKGWPTHGETPAQAALTEAREEAGVVGRSLPICVGLYSYQKMIRPDEFLPCVVSVFPVQVERLSKSYREKGQRKRKWMSRKKAAARVENRELAEILSKFDPRMLRT